VTTLTSPDKPKLRAKEADMGGPILNQVNVVVTDMERSTAFYRLLGLELADPPPDWQPHHRPAASPGDGLDFELDSEAFAAQWNTGRTASASSAHVVIGFRLPGREAVDATYSRLTLAGYRGQQPPFDAFWGARYAVVEDPDGNPVGLMSPVAAADRRPPPPPPSPSW
jgi:catechol 2,3-dioxygenase-like lactoylglutathione lyase family enzyme